MNEIPSTCGKCHFSQTTLWPNYVECLHPDLDKTKVTANRKYEQAPPVDPRVCPLRRAEKPTTEPERDTDVLKEARRLLEFHEKIGLDGDGESCIDVIRGLVAALEKSEWAISRLEMKAVTPKMEAFAKYGEKVYLSWRGDGDAVHGVMYQGVNLEALALSCGIRRLVDEEKGGETVDVFSVGERTVTK